MKQVPSFELPYNQYTFQQYVNIVIGDIGIPALCQCKTDELINSSDPGAKYEWKIYLVYCTKTKSSNCRCNAYNKAHIHRYPINHIPKLII
jgi:hypothetical protein